MQAMSCYTIIKIRKSNGCLGEEIYLHDLSTLTDAYDLYAMTMNKDQTMLNGTLFIHKPTLIQ